MFRHFSKYLQGKPEKLAIDFSGVWVNELGLEMELTVNDSSVRDTYWNVVGKVLPAETFELTGFAWGDRIVFVSFGRYGTLGAWTGLHGEEKGKREIYSLWHLPRGMQDDEEAKNIFKRKRASRSSIRLPRPSPPPSVTDEYGTRSARPGRQKDPTVPIAKYGLPPP